MASGSGAAPAEDGSLVINGAALSKTQVDIFKQLFDFLDEDGSGNISKTEVMTLLRLLGMKVSPEQLNRMLVEADEDGSGEISFDEFLKILAGGGNYSPAELMRDFRIFADPRMPPGCITAKALEEALTTYCSDKVDLDEALQLVYSMDPNPQGIINYVEKVHTFCGTHHQ